MSQQLCNQATLAPNAEIVFGLEGSYLLRVMKADADGDPIESTAREIEFPNLITNFGMDSIGNTSSSSNDNFWGGCAVGSGNATPDNSDTALQTQIAYVTDALATVPGTVSRQVATSPRYIEILRTWRFGAGAATGNIAEVGIRRESGAPNSLFSRALVVDGGGTPTTITVLSDEILDVTYRFRWYVPETDLTGTVVLDGLSCSYTLRAVNIGAAAAANSPGWPTTFSGANTRLGFRALGSTGAVNAASTANSVATVAMTAMAALPVLTGITGRGTTDVVFATYGAGTYFNDATYTWPITAGNSSGIQLVVMSTPWGSFQLGLSPTFTKLSTQRLRFVLRITWARR